MPFKRPCLLALCTVLLAAQSHAHESHEPRFAAAAKAAVRKSSLPARKSGLWEVTVRSDDLVLRRQGQAQQRPQTVQMCTSAEAEPVMLFAVVPGQTDCHEVRVTRRARNAGGGYDISTVCYVHDNRVDAHMDLRGDLESAYSGSYSVKYTRTPLQNTGRMVFEGRWMGACKPGQRAGDMVLPNGVTVNVVDAVKRAAEGHGHEGHNHKH